MSTVLLADTNPAHAARIAPNTGRKPLHVALCAFGFLLLQNLDILTFPLFGIERSPMVATHMHWGALLMVAMLNAERVYLRVGFITVLVGWVARYLAQAPEINPLTIIAAPLLYALMYAWTVLCAHWMGWPRPLEQRELHIGNKLHLGDMLPYAAIALLLYPLGWALVLLGAQTLIGGHWHAGLIDNAEHAFLSLMFGVLCTTLPSVLLGTGPEQRGRQLVNTRDLLFLIAYLCLLRLLIAGLSSTPAHIPATVLELRFIIALALVACIIRLRWRRAALLIGLTSLMLPMVTEIPHLGAGSEALRMLRMALEMGALQLLLAFTMLLIRDKRRILERLSTKSRHDVLSGVPNLNALYHDLEKRALTPESIGCLGIERLDTMMEGLGLAAQERLTAAIHQHLLPEVRAYTLGMGRFALLPAAQQHTNWQKSVLNKLERFDFNYANTRIRVEPHLGVCALEGRGSAEVDAALHAAYSAMLSAWQHGETVPVIAPQQPPSLPARKTLQTHALALSLVRQHQIELHVQPLQRIDGTGSANMGEVLCRLRAPDGRLVMPAEYMAELEASRSMVELDQEVVKSVLMWMSAHPDNAGLSRLCVNLTGLSLVSVHFRNWLLKQLDVFPDVTKRLCFELTEHAIGCDIARARPLLDALKQRGCLIALDDFGTGMQGFERLQRLHIDIIKIDGRFVRNVATNPQDRALIRAMTTIASAYGAQTVAEHVEDATVLQHLHTLGVNWVQGYHISRPLPLSVVASACGR